MWAGHDGVQLANVHIASPLKRKLLWCEVVNEAGGAGRKRQGSAGHLVFLGSLENNNINPNPKSSKFSWDGSASPSASLVRVERQCSCCHRGWGGGSRRALWGEAASSAAAP